MHRFQVPAPAPTLSSKDLIQKQAFRVSNPPHASPYNHFINQCAPPITNPPNTVPNHVDAVVPKERPNEELGDISNVALPDLLKVINPQLEAKWKLGAPDAYQMLLSNNPSTPQEEMSVYLDQIVSANSTSSHAGSFVQSRKQVVHSEGPIAMNSHVQQVPSTQAMLAFAAQQSSQVQNIAPVPTIVPNTNLTARISIPDVMNTVNVVPSLSQAHTPLDAITPARSGALDSTLPMVSGTQINASSMVTLPNIGNNVSIAGSANHPATAIAGAARHSTPVAGHAFVTGPRTMEYLAAHPTELASPVPPTATEFGPTEPVGGLGLHIGNGVNPVHYSGQIPHPQDGMQPEVMLSTPSMPSTMPARQASLATDMVMNRAAAAAADAAAATAASTSSALRMPPSISNPGAYHISTIQPTVRCETGMRKGNIPLKQSGSPRKAKASEELAVKNLKKEEVTLEIEAVSSSQGDDTGSDDAETKKAMRAERNRQSAAASRERKKHYIKELEKRVGVLSKANAEIQMEQIKLVNETIAAERKHVLTVTFKDMEIAKLRNQVAELSPSLLAEKAQRKSKTWDSVDMARRIARMNLSR